MRHNLIDRLKEEWAQLDPVDPLRGLISDAIDALHRKPLTDGEIDLMTSHIYHRGRPVDRDYRICLFREAEAAHGIKGDA